MSATFITQYLIKVGERLYEPKTEVRQATLEEMQRFWPRISWQPECEAVAVWFPLMPFPTIIHRSQVEQSVSTGQQAAG